jgi:UDP-N-acetylmuramoyl-tripeptide--D-alanyl-D-alanine ligase
MMDRADPFFGYSFLLRTLLFVVVPVFAAWQFVRLRRALHVFQLEGYKRDRFLEWVRANRGRAWFLQGPSEPKKPLVLTGRAWRILVAATAVSIVAILAASAAAHLAGGAPLDLIFFVVVTGIVFVAAPRILILADVLLAPAQNAINARYLSAARRKLDETSPLVVAITGSFGKTSTKFAVAGLIGPREDVLVTPRSYNTPLGVCRTINEQMARSHRYFVVEIGAYREGDVEELCRFVRPRIGVLTAVGPAHLERFGSLDAIRRAKYEIVTSLPPEGIAVMNVDDPEVRKLADGTSDVEVVRYGLDEAGGPHIGARSVSFDASGMTLTIVDNRSSESLEVHTKLLGRHAAGHILAGVGVALAAGRTIAELHEPIALLEPVEHRLQMIEGAGGVTVIDDAYNSNPEGAAAALEVLASMPGMKKVVVTPGIIELGPLQAQENARFGERVARVADVLIVVAKVNRDAIVEGAESAGGVEVVTVDSLGQATERLATILSSGDVVLFENDLPDQYET